MRKTVSCCLYLLLVDLFAYALVVFPVYAFQLSSSTTGYVRVASQPAVSTMLSAQRAASVAALATGISASTAGSVALRLVASSVGWPALGIVAGMTLAMYVYDQTKVAQIKAAAAGPGTFSIPGWTNPFTGPVTVVSQSYLKSPFYAQYDSAIVAECRFNAMPFGWEGPFSGGTDFPGQCIYFHLSTSPETAGTVTPAAPATESQIASMIASLPASDPNSLESNTVLVGAQSQPTPADSTSALPVPETGLVTSVVPATDVQPTDLVVNPNANPPSGTQTTKTQTQPTTETSTKTTTTTTNPDGSVTTTSTDTSQDEAVVSCAAGTHDQRTFGSILQEHLTLWSGSGLLSALNLLKTLTWPSDPPTYSLQSVLLGNFTLDFSSWSGMLTAIRSIIIAIAGFVAYRIIFVGGR